MSLVLRRRPGERVLLILPDGGRITVELHYLAEHPVKLLFDAPAGVRIVREELLMKEAPHDP